MIRYKMDLSDEKRETAIEIALNREKNVRRRKIIVPLSSLVGIVEIIVGIYICTKRLSISSIVILVIGIFMLFLAINAKSFQRYALRKSEKLLDSSFRSGVIEYIFDEDGIQIVSELGHSKNYWNAFKKYGTMGQYFYIKRKDNQMILVDQNDLTKDEIEELKHLLSYKIDM